MNHTRHIAVEFKDRHVGGPLVHQIASQALSLKLKGELGAVVIVARSFSRDAWVAEKDLKKSWKKHKISTKLILVEAQTNAEYDRLKDQFHADPAAALEAIG